MLYTRVLPLDQGLAHPVVDRLKQKLELWCQHWFIKNNPIQFSLTREGTPEAVESDNNRILCVEDELFLQYSSLDAWFVLGVLGIKQFSYVTPEMPRLKAIQNKVLSSLLESFSAFSEDKVQCEAKNSQQWVRLCPYSIKVTLSDGERELGSFRLFDSCLRGLLATVDKKPLPPVQEKVRLLSTESVTLESRLVDIDINGLELMNLSVGDVIQLNKRLDSPFDISSNGNQLLRGFLAQNNGHKVFLLTK